MKKLKEILSIGKVITVVLLLTSIAITSCGGNSNMKESKNSSTVVVPQSNEIRGYLGKYLGISDETYKIEKDGKMIFSWIVKVKVYVKAKYEDNDYGLQDGNGGPLYLDLYDNNGSPLTGFNNLKSDYNSDVKLADILSAGVGETWITFTKFHERGTEELPQNIVSFTIGSKKVEKSTTSDVKTNDNEDYDKVLDDYEDYVDNYLVFLKKANEGDISAIEEYTELLEKAEDLSESLETAKTNNGLTPKQLSRMLKIQNKMTSAIVDMK